MKKPNLQRLAQRSKIYLRKASPTILSGLGAAGVIVTSVLAVRATPKALRKSKWIKAIGVAATVIGVGVNLITDWVNEQKMDEKIEEKVSEALARRDKDEAEES